MNRLVVATSFPPTSSLVKVYNSSDSEWRGMFLSHLYDFVFARRRSGWADRNSCSTATCRATSVDDSLPFTSFINKIWKWTYQIVFYSAGDLQRHCLQVCGQLYSQTAEEVPGWPFLNHFVLSSIGGNLLCAVSISLQRFYYRSWATWIFVEYLKEVIFYMEVVAPSV